MSNKGRHAKWVKPFIGPDQWVKRINGQYCLYGIESGKEELIGIITKEGILESEERIERRTNIVYEYGASKTLFQLCPSRWKESVGTGWEQCLLYIISEISPNSFFLRHGWPECPGNMPHLTRKKLDLFLVQEHGCSIAEIFDKMGGVYLLINKETGKQRLSTLSEEQLNFAKTHNLYFDMEVQ